MVKKYFFPDTVILHIPHSATAIPEMQGFLVDPKDEIIKLTDWATEKIFNIEGIDQIIFPYSRVFCDVERFADDSIEPMARVGMGFFYTHTDEGAVMRKNIGNIKETIYQKYYVPHHDKLRDITKKKLSEHSVARIIDCHSFTDTPFLRDRDQSPNRPDICIGTDSYHTPDYLTEYMSRFFLNKGFSVDINRPYAGSIVPIDYYEKDARVESIMIEINRKLYMNGTKIINEKVEEFRNMITELVTTF